MPLPRALEAAVQGLEQLARDVSVKIDEAAEVVADEADPSIVRQAHELAQAVRARPPPDAPPAVTPPRSDRRG